MWPIYRPQSPPLVPVGDTNRDLRSTRIVCFFQALVRRWIRGVFLLRDCELLDQHYHDHFVSHMDPIYSPPPGHVQHSVSTHCSSFWYTKHSDSLHTSNGAFDMRALTSHRWAVCR